MALHFKKTKQDTHNYSVFNFGGGLSFKEQSESLGYLSDVQDAIWFQSEICYVKIELLPAVDLIFEVSMKPSI